MVNPLYFLKGLKMNNKFDSIRKLNFEIGDYILTGSSPMGIRGLREINDVDIVVSNRLWEKLEKQYGSNDDNGNKKIIISEDIEVFGEASFYNFEKNENDPSIDERIEKADIIDGLAFESLEHVLYYKTKMGRPKDLKDIELIRQFINRR